MIDPMDYSKLDQAYNNLLKAGFRAIPATKIPLGQLHVRPDGSGDYYPHPDRPDGMEHFPVWQDATEKHGANIGLIMSTRDAGILKDDAEKETE